MRSLQNLLVAVILLHFLLKVQGRPVEQKDNDGVQLRVTDTVDLILPEKLSFRVPDTCTGWLKLCYETSTTLTTDSVNTLYNPDIEHECPPGNCIITFDVAKSEDFGIVKIKSVGTYRIGSFDDNLPKYCARKKTNSPQKFTVLQLPNCLVTVVGASQPGDESKEDEKEEEKENEKDSEEEVGKAPAKDANLKWIIILGIGIVLSIALLIGVIIFIWRSWRSKSVENPAQPPRIPEIKVVKSPAPTSPIVAPTSPMPTESPSNVAPSTLKTDAVSPSVAEKPTQNIVSRAQKVRKQKKNKKQRGWEVYGVKTLNTTTTNAEDDDSPKYDMAAKLAEDAPRCLHRLDLLEYRGMSPCQSGSQLHPFLQHVDKDYNTFPRRKIAEEEIELFLSITSDAFMMLPGLLKRARQELCRYGAVYTHRRWISFNAVTRHYLRQITTPGFIAWYGFAGEHGRLVKLKDNKGTEKILAKMSVPALLVVVFREQLRTPIRRNAFAKLRVRLTEVACLHPTNELLGKAYPICLIPEMLKKDAKKFRDGANDMAYSTPFEVLKQDAKNEATEEDENTDETQATFSDGKKRDVLGSVEVMGTQTEATVTVKEDLF